MMIIKLVRSRRVHRFFGISFSPWLLLSLFVLMIPTCLVILYSSQQMTFLPKSDLLKGKLQPFIRHFFSLTICHLMD